MSAGPHPRPIHAQHAICTPVCAAPSKDADVPRTLRHTALGVGKTLKGCNCVIDKRTLTAGGDNLETSVDPSFQAGFPFPAPEILHCTAPHDSGKLLRIFAEILFGLFLGFS